MIKIPQKKHNEMMAKTFTQEELEKILPFIDEQITGLETNLDVWKRLISMYIKIPEGRLSKIYIYQVMALNGIIDEDRYNKSMCNQKLNCSILNENAGIETRKICNNLSKCLFLPYFQLEPPFLPTNKEFVEIDEAILKM